MTPSNVTNPNIKFKYKHIPSLLWESAKEWNQDNVWQLSASIAYYAILSLPGLLIILISIVGVIWDQDIATGRLTSDLTGLIGWDAAEDINKMLQTADRDNGILASLVGVVTLLFGATGLFVHLQISLNKIWRLKVAPKTPWWKLLTDRAKSFGFILVLGFLILISFILTAIISMLQDIIQTNFPDYLIYLAHALNFLIALVIISLLFGLMFRYLPDSDLKWKVIWPGAILTALLFELGKFLLELYFSNASPASAYGAAGILVLLLLWVSYSALILFYGAEFVKVYAKRYHNGIQPNSKAVKYREEVVELPK
ncbi:YihY/virulence factor BrkB family protein [Nonlabens marinus]|uniref:Inner membrane protein YihY, formerly thought to be RNase BN n=1 Tax=Nonlabens marinus S1-08 TaxID=1454201 RepID=W8VS24_9FLAO|nr:YihY/virulence factor BrkB family protein [Nonlabens marinus]BAO55965.1 inner membrane protein YihY, formerly thought to be RNase BN [Nonlabens marinus S1-08]